MTWQAVATIATSEDWVLTEPILGNLFRLTHSLSGNNSLSLRSVIAQAFEENGTVTYFDIRRVTYKSETEAFLFVQPGGLLNRKLAIKRLDNLLDNWIIQIEVLDGMPESISLPISINEVTSLQEKLDSKAETPLAITEVFGLPEVLEDKAPYLHNHSIAEVNNLEATLSNKIDENDPRLDDERKPLLHGHSIAQVTGLQTALDNKVGTNDGRLSDTRVPLGFVSSLGATGFQKIYGGRLEQWGGITVGPFNYTAETYAIFNVSWSVAFNTLFRARVSLISGLYYSAQSHTISDLTINGGKIYFRCAINLTNATLTFHYAAIGV